MSSFHSTLLSSMKLAFVVLVALVVITVLTEAGITLNDLYHLIPGG